eukprot:TRINITY_DN830_c0_g1_i2.p1 TRINITY_DN830_c0_g1~~TRINITY_DN830_c0_g1_i2.p1  ORF type:complete len:230 (-),score=3.41 TRINITY_DN830_c0_g1_i2:41-730(-)
MICILALSLLLTFAQVSQGFGWTGYGHSPYNYYDRYYDYDRYDYYGYGGYGPYYKDYYYGYGGYGPYYKDHYKGYYGYGPSSYGHGHSHHKYKRSTDAYDTPTTPTYPVATHYVASTHSAPLVSGRVGPTQVFSVPYGVYSAGNGFFSSHGYPTTSYPVSTHPGSHRVAYSTYAPPVYPAPTTYPASQPTTYPSSHPVVIPSTGSYGPVTKSIATPFLYNFYPTASYNH